MTRKAIIGRVSFSMGMAVALLLVSLLILGSASAANADAQAEYWAVCPIGCDYPMIQQAVDAAGENDVIRVVGNNVYTENIVITKSLTLQGGCANAACSVPLPGVFVTTIDGGGADRVVTIDGGGELITVTVGGFVITGGDPTTGGYPYDGGGVGSWDANLVLSRNIITGNIGATDRGGKGGGLYVYSGTVDIANNQVLSNRAGASGHNGYGGGIALEYVSGQLASNLVRDNLGTDGGSSNLSEGGGVFIDACDALSVANNVIRDNTAAMFGLGYGGGLFAEASTALTLTDNVIYANTGSVGDNGYGGGLSINQSSVLLDGNTIQENVASRSAYGAGGGARFYRGEVVLDHNIILSNTATFSDTGYGGGLCFTLVTATLSGDAIFSNTAELAASFSYGSGMFVDVGVLITATNVVVAQNRAPGNGPAIQVTGEATHFSTMAMVNSTVVDNAYKGIGCTGATSLTLVNLILWGNEDDLDCPGVDLSYSDVEDGDTGPGVIHQDPLFVDPTGGDYHLLPDSPCIDAGASPVTHTLVPDWDWDGDDRPIGDGYDIGADEARMNVYLPLVLRDS